MNSSQGAQGSSLQSGGSVAYRVDPGTSLFQVHAFASGLVSAIAHSPKFEIKGWFAEVRLNPGPLSKGTIHAIVKADDLKLVDEVSESDRRMIFKIMHSEVLETRTYPEIVFLGDWSVTRQISPVSHEVHVSGSLSLHGVTNAHSFNANVDLGDDTFRAVGKFDLLQSDFGIKTVSIGGSALTLRDDLVFRFFVVGRKSAGAK